MRGKIIGGVWLILTIASLGWMLQQWQEISNYSNQLGLRYESGILSKEAIEGYYEKHPTDSLQITAWDQIENQQVRELKLDRKSVADVYQVSGNMALLFPMKILYGGLSCEEDLRGCMISSGLAWTLYGATDVVGQSVEYSGATYLIRGVLNEEHAWMAVYQSYKKALMSCVELWDDSKQVAASIDSIQSNLSLYGENYQFVGSLYNSIARLLLGIPYFLCLFLLYGRYRKWLVRKNKTEKGQKEGNPSGKKYTCRIISQILIGLCFLVAFYIGIRLCISFTADFIPTSWSDFSFYSNKLSDITSNMENMRKSLPVFWETQILMALKNLACAVILFCIEIIPAVRG